MQNVRFVVFFRVIRNAIRKRFLRDGVGITKVGVRWDVLEIFSLSVHERKQFVVFFALVFIPAGDVATHRFSRPAVSDRMKNKISLFDFGNDFMINFVYIERFGREIRCSCANTTFQKTRKNCRTEENKNCIRSLADNLSSPRRFRN